MKVSVVIPCRNEEKYIAGCLDSVLASDFDTRQLDIIVVDGMSDDNTLAVVKKYMTWYACISLVENPGRTTQYALNKGIRLAKGDVVIILGAHAEVSPGYIAGCVAHLQSDRETVCVGGLVENIYDNNTSKIIGYAMSSRFGVGNARFRTGGSAGYADTVAFGAYRKEIFDYVGLFDEDLVRNQDDEFNYRIVSRGYKIYFDPELKLKYYTRASFGKLFRQYYQYGYWKVYVNRKHKTVTTVRQLIPALFVLFLVLGFVLSFAGIYTRLAYRLVLLLYLGIGIKSGLEKTDTIKELFQFMYACLILHISYGSGYLWGIVHFIIMKLQPSEKSKVVTR